MKILLIAFLAMFSITANAGIIIPDGSGILNGTFSGNDVLGARANLAHKGGNIIGDGQLGPFDVTFTYIGSEAGYSNDFDFGLNNGSATGASIFNNKSGASAGDSVSFTNLTLIELLDFGFYSNTSGKFARNGSNDSNLATGSFAAIFNTNAFTYDGFNFGTFDAIIGFDDSGAGPDGDFDDVVIGINVSRTAEVPEPASAALLGLGLVAFGLRRKFANVKA